MNLIKEPVTVFFELPNGQFKEIGTAKDISLRMETDGGTDNAPLITMPTMPEEMSIDLPLEFLPLDRGHNAVDLAEMHLGVHEAECILSNSSH